MSSKRLIHDLEYSELIDIFSHWDEPEYRVDQLWNGLYINLWKNPNEFTTFSKELRMKLNSNYSFSHLYPDKGISSEDNNTIKYLFKLPAGNYIESVLMDYRGNKNTKRQRYTVCISTQAGCSVGCEFCATGKMGFKHNLSSGEIVEQFLFFSQYLEEQQKRITNVVFMGMGEPFLNYEETIKAIDLLMHEKAFNIGARRITVSTVGIIPGMQQFSKEYPQVNMAVSLHAAENELRNKLVPINRKYPLEELITACQDHISNTKRRITFEWALINGVNDSLKQAKKLSQWLKPLYWGDAPACHVNLIPLNPIIGLNQQATSIVQMKSFKHYLENEGIPCTIRVSRGTEIRAGCGQLVDPTINITA